VGNERGRSCEKFLTGYSRFNLDGHSYAGNEWYTAKIRTMSADIPIIAVTAHAFYTEQKQALAAGCNEVVSKPYSMEQLKVAIEKYI